MGSYRPTCDLWIMARPKVKYHGAYPSGSLHRMRELLGITVLDPLLHVCSGMVRSYPIRGVGPNDYTVDLDPKLEPDFLMDVREGLPPCPHDPDGWPALLADPPYTEEDAAKYEPGAEVLPSPNKLLKIMLEAVRPGGRVGMLHYVWPRPPTVKKGKSRVTAIESSHRGRSYLVTIRTVACVGMITGFGNKIRCYSVFEKEPPKEVLHPGPDGSALELVRADVHYLRPRG